MKDSGSPVVQPGARLPGPLQATVAIDLTGTGSVQFISIIIIITFSCSSVLFQFLDFPARLATLMIRYNATLICVYGASHHWSSRASFAIFCVWFQVATIHFAIASGGGPELYSTFPMAYVVFEGHEVDIRAGMVLGVVAVLPLLVFELTWPVGVASEMPEIPFRIVRTSNFAINIAVALYFAERNRRLGTLAVHRELEADRAMAQNVQKNIFITNLSHDMRTPLSCILGAVEILRESLDALPCDTERPYQLTNILEASAKSQLQTVDGLLQVARVRTLQVFASPYNIGDLHSLAETLAVKIQKKKIEFCVFIDPYLPSVVTDKEKLLRILQNLVDNATNFSRKGTIELAVQLVSRDKTTVRVHFSVSDTGTGIPPGKREDIFDAFVSNARKEGSQQEGLGIGLFTASEYVKLLGGEINLESEVGRGSKFSFELTFPLSDLTVELPQYTKKVAFLSTCEGNQKSFRAVASSVGCISYDVFSLEQALLLARSDNLDLIVVDIPIAGASEVLRDPPQYIGDVLVVRAVGVHTAGSKCITKPFSPASFVSMMKSLRARQDSSTPACKSTPSLTPRSKNARPFPGVKVLIVDDNNTNVMITTWFCEKLGLTCFSECNGQDAVTKLRKHPSNYFDVVFMDCQMPIQDGRSATREHRECENTHARGRQLIIGLTAHVSETEREACLQAGMDDVLIKPFVLSELEEMLRKHLGDRDG